MKRILVIDDNKDFADVFCEILQNYDLQAESCYSGEEAVARVQEQVFDLTFLDIKMPGMDGVQTLREIKSLRPEAAVVMMTGYSMEGHFKDALKAKANAIIHKPFDIEKVIGLIDASC